MALNDDILKHQLLLMRLVKTQAKTTLKIIKQAEAIILKAIRNKKYFLLRERLNKIFEKLPKEALKLLLSLGIYERDFIVKKIRFYRNSARTVNNKEVKEKILQTPVSVALRRPPLTIEDTYKQFAEAKTKQYTQAIVDSVLLNEDQEVLETKIKDLTKGLFTVQNEALAGVAVIGVANMIRAIVADENDMLVVWTAILDDHVCEFCESMDGSIFRESEIEQEIPAHSRCRCTWLLADAA